MSGFSVDVDGLTQTVQAILETGRRVPELVGKAVEVTARHVKDDAKTMARQILRSDGPVKHDPSTETYELARSGWGGFVEATIGPHKGWAQAGIPLEAGTPYRAATPILEPALMKNREDFIIGLSKAVGDAL